MIYLDNNSTTQYSSSVKEYLKKDFIKDWFNPSSEYDYLSQKLSSKIIECKQYISNYINGSANTITFTSGATESINTILSLGTLKKNNLKSIITSHLEHHATLNKIKNLKEVPVFYVKNNQQGEIDYSDLKHLCSKNPCSLISLLFINNETGVITDIKKVVTIAKKYKCMLHVDAVQALGKWPIDCNDLNIDFASFSGHKIGSFKGVGFIYTKKPIEPLLFGGEQQSIRAGTYNYPAIYSLKLALQDIDLNKQNSLKLLRNNFEQNLLKINKQIKINCYKANRISNTSNIYFQDISNLVLVLYLAKHKIYVSTGSACNSSSPEPSHVIQALGYNKHYARSCVRVSLSTKNTQLELDLIIDLLKKFYKNI